MIDYHELEYENVISILVEDLEDQSYVEYYNSHEELYSYSPEWSDYGNYTEYWSDE
jgi:hypothetical protein